MSGLEANGSVPSQPAPLPKSPPEYPDLCGKRRELAKLQLLEREIGFLEEELKSVELGLQPASRPCKEVTDFATCSADPFIPLAKTVPRSCRFWKRIWICCCSCSATNCCGCSEYRLCNGCESCRNGQCFNMVRCSWNCCLPKKKCSSCVVCCSVRCRCYPKCHEVNMCS